MTIYNITEEQSKRLNMLKMLLAIFVVLLHSNFSEIGVNGSVVALQDPTWLATIKHFFSNTIALCCNAGFFLISSILLYRKNFSWTKNIIKKSKTVLIPYFLLNTILILLYALFQAIPLTKGFFGDTRNIVSNFTLTRWLGVYGIGEAKPILIPTWFLRNLFVFNLFSIVIKKCIDRFPVISALLIILYTLADPFDFWYCLYPSDLFFWCAGYYIVKYNKSLNYFDFKKYIPLIYCIYAIISTILFIMGIELKGLIWNIWELFDLCISIIFWYSVCTKFFINSKQNVLLKYSAYSFCIFMFHYPMLETLQKISLKVLPTSPMISLITYFAFPIVVIITSVILGFILAKYLPKLFSIVTGGHAPIT